MFHMISCFNLKPGEDIESFCSAYALFVDEIKRIDLVESSSPVGQRQNDARNHEYFAVMSFRDRVQVDTAYEHIMQHVGSTDAAHDAVYTHELDPVFICWQDLP